MLLLLLLGLPGVAYAFSTFTLNCTAPTELTNFVAGGNTRSTLDILWSCLFTIFTCTWTALHLNVPEQRQGRDPGKWGDFKWMTKRFFRKCGWMVATIMIPEFIIFESFERLAFAVVARNAMKQRAAEDGVEWGLTHAFFANMGGFAIKTRSAYNGKAILSLGSHILPNVETKDSVVPEISGDASAATEPNSIPQIGKHPNASQSIFNSSAESSGFASLLWDSRLVSVASAHILVLLEKGMIAKLPDIRADEINDKSKNDILVKSLAVVQILSVVIQVIARHALGLAVSQLELIVTAFSFCAIIAYSVSFYMPKDVQTPIIIADLTATVSFEEAIKLVGRSDMRVWGAGQTEFDPGIPWDAFPVNLDSLSKKGLNIILYLAGGLFGAIHCFAWNFSFPTSVEQTLWRIASVLSTGLPTMFLVAVLIEDHLFEPLSIIARILGSASYCLARLYIIVEVFRTLFFLPPSAFISTWASNIPQVG